MWDGFVDQIVAALRTIPVAGWPTYDLFPSANVAFDAWTTDHFDITVRTHPGLKADIWGPGADPDRDDYPNAVEAGFGMNPLQADTPPYTASRQGNDFVLRWLRPALFNTHGVRLETQINYGVGPGSPPWREGPPVQTASGAPFGFIALETRLPMGNHPVAFQRFGATTP